jgi:hypothetical protein
MPLWARSYCIYSSYYNTFSLAWAVDVTRRPLTPGTQVCSQASQCRNCGEQSGTGIGFSPSTSISTITISSLMLHMQSFIYHQRCMLFPVDTLIKNALLLEKYKICS